MLEKVKQLSLKQNINNVIAMVDPKGDRIELKKIGSTNELSQFIINLTNAPFSPAQLNYFSPKVTDNRKPSFS
jgi:hypothetical protein